MITKEPKRAKETKADWPSTPLRGSAREAAREDKSANETISRIARKMLDLHFCGTLVNTDSLASAGFTIKEINEHWEAARDEATIMERENNRAA